MAHFEITMQTDKLITAGVWEDGKNIMYIFFRKNKKESFFPSCEIPKEIRENKNFSLVKEKILKKFKNKKIFFKIQK